MADPASRKSATLSRLRSQLRRKRESLADQFDFKMYIAVVFKDKVSQKRSNDWTDCKSQMADPASRKSATLSRLRSQLRRKRESLADQFDFKMYIAVVFKDKDVIGCVQEIDFFLWPRSDIDRIVCLLFSRWKGNETSEYRLIQGKFEFEPCDYEKQLLRLLSRKEHTGLIINNPSQSLFFFVNKHQLQAEKSKVAVFKISSICLHIPQDQLTHWGTELREHVLAPFMPD
ncbi:uncharacterized protein C6orf62 homolog [Orbicella faveolata]|uniref:uncharacterized protein C6orf62 homolog n=1 Tax=Orbicella faveolata TaxID=48498 RepID=UPI0009E395C7|nr:uncharacterized protein C6orf62 homolog [Orbicella faveolata]